MSLRALFLDFNSYFASVEQQAQPRLRGRPVAVVPAIVDTTCCIAASYEARKFGIKTGTKVWEAKRLCPQLQLVAARPEMYARYHHQLLQVVDSCIPIREVKSVDELVCDLRGSQRRREKCVALAHKIKDAIKSEVGPYLRCSIGIAPNTFLAKTATELQKPDGLVVIELCDLPHCLFGLELRDLCGIGTRMERRLWNHGIVSVEQLCRASRARLKNVWGGALGERMYDELRGIEVVRPIVQRASVGHSHVLPPPLRNEIGARSTLCRLLQKAAWRLRKLKRDSHCYQTGKFDEGGYCAGGLGVCVKFAQNYWWDKTSFPHTRETAILTRHLLALWSAHPRDWGVPVKVSVVLFALKPMRECNLSLFENGTFLDETIDYLNEKFGRMTIYLGGAHEARTKAAPPIAFNFVPEGMETPQCRPGVLPVRNRFALRHDKSIRE
jgi:DNA polymerase-4